MLPKEGKILSWEVKFFGFTLVELLVVIAIVGFLSTIVLAVTSGVSEQGRIAKGLQFGKHLENSLGAYLVGRWSFDEGVGSLAKDTSGWDNSGTLINSPTWRCVATDSSYTPSGNGCSLEFNGSNGYVDFGNDGSLQTFNSITLEAWVYPKSFTAYTVILGKDTPYYYGIKSPGNVLYLRHDNLGGGWTNVNLSTAIAINKWYHIVATWDGSTVRIYLNGEYKGGQGGLTGTISSTESSLAVGSYHGVTAADHMFPGLIDEVRIYSTALTASQIQSQYYAGLNRLLAKKIIDEQEYQARVILK
jgi:prepilin-type N-terminal cleavage/methylation domain-containing protein